MSQNVKHRQESFKHEEQKTTQMGENKGNKSKKRYGGRTQGKNKPVNELNRSINILSAYGELNKFMLIAKIKNNKAKKEAQKVIDHEVKIQKKMKRKLKKE